MNRTRESRPISAGDIKEYLDSRDDFDLELFAYRTLREHGIQAHHGKTYSDPATGIPRQYDIRALKVWDSGTAVSLAVECKSLTPECPLIVSCVPRPKEDSYHELVRADAINPYVPAMGVRRPGDWGRGLYQIEGMVGKKTSQIRWDPKKGFIEGDRESFDRWSQALASVHGLLSAAVQARTPGLGFFFTWVLPVLVVSDKTLWIVKYDDEGRRSDPVQVDEVTYLVGRDYELPPHSRVNISHLHIYTRKGFTEFVQQLANVDSRRLWHLVFEGAPGLGS